MAKHHKQIEYVEPNTLIVGIDIGKQVHFVKMMLDGVEVAAFKLYNEGSAFMALLKTIDQVKNQHQCTASLIEVYSKVVDEQKERAYPIVSQKTKIPHTREKGHARERIYPI